MEPLRIYDSLTQQCAPFTPRQTGKVKLYVCGMTVYDRCHIGHGRIMVWFDVVVRYLRSLGLKVTYVRNITDIDDKIINRAYERGEPVTQLVNHYIELMRQDEQQLQLLPPDHQPRVTQHIPAIIQLIKRLIESGHAYQVEATGDVYYDVQSFPAYGQLSHQDLASLQVGARVEVNQDKRNPLDFALWKAAKPNEPHWDSPWGQGRPGWHIECSAMAQYYLGDTMDIHGGGRDLIFPHHQNEIAQTEAVTGLPLARYWMHVGYVQLQAQKMSKSLNNFILLSDILAQWHGEVLRFFLLSSHYRSELNFTKEGMLRAESSLRRLYLALRYLVDLQEKQRSDARLQEQLAALTQQLQGKSLPTERQQGTKDNAVIMQPPTSLTDWQRLMDNPVLGELAQRFQAALADDFNTPQALAVLFEITKRLNQMASKHDWLAVWQLALGLCTLGQVLGLLQQAPIAFLHSGINSDLVQQLVNQRSTARQAQNWSLADQLRQQLQTLGVEIEDRPDGCTAWFYLGNQQGHDNQDGNNDDN